jgi:predicted permease
VGTTLLPLSLDVQMNARAFVFLMALSTLTVLLFSAVPAFAASRAGIEGVLRAARSGGGWRGRQALIVFQIALCTFLLTGASLFVRTFHELHDMDPGFDRDHVATFTGDLTLSGDRSALPRLLTERVRQIPGVVSAAIASKGVMRGRGLGATVAPTGQPALAGDYLNSSFNEVSPGYFDTMGMRILAGRALAGSDAESGRPAGPKNVVVNQAFVRRFFPNVNAVGQRFGVGVKAVEGADNEIVGVVGDARYRSLREPVVPTFYKVGTEYFGFVLNVRTHARPESIFRAVPKALASIDPAAAFLEIHTLAAEVDDSTAAERLTAVLVSVLGAIAMLLAGAGIYGLLAYAIVRRRREIGIRMALGAVPTDIARLVGREGLTMAAGGIVFGLAAALAAGPWIRSLLYGISPWDPKSLSAAAIFVAVVAVGATAIPVLQATHIEPTPALRQED